MLPLGDKQGLSLKGRKHSTILNDKLTNFRSANTYSDFNLQPLLGGFKLN